MWNISRDSLLAIDMILDEEQEMDLAIAKSIRGRVEDDQFLLDFDSGLDHIATPTEFLKSINKSTRKLMLTAYTEKELEKMQLHKHPDFDCGYALKDFLDPNGKVHKFAELVGVHNCDIRVKGLGCYIIQNAIKNGARFLDHFGAPQLNNLYETAGFKEYHRELYDKTYDVDGKFAREYGELPVIYRKLDK